MSCGDDDSENGLSCAEATQNTFTALSNFTNAGSTDYETLCNAYKLNLQQQKDACGDPSGQIQTILDGLGDCTEDVTDVGTGDNN
jgi:hypothetical protein